MAGWDGAGNFVRNYNWATDAANGIKILASKMDTEFNTYATGLMNCLTRDGQNSPSADINWGGKKITGLANGVATTDAATVGQIVGNEWVSETAGFAWVAATQIQITAVDATATYHVGRRVKFKDNGTQRYATITASAYGTDTVLTLVVDGDYALTGAITLLAYGIVSYINSSYLRLATTVQTYLSASQTGLGTTQTQILFDSVEVDAMSELLSNKVVVKCPGNYLISLHTSVIFAGAVAASGTCTAQLYITGHTGLSDIALMQLSASTGVNNNITTIVTLPAGGQIYAYITCSTGTANAIVGGAGATQLNVTRTL